MTWLLAATQEVDTSHAIDVGYVLDVLFGLALLAGLIYGVIGAVLRARSKR
jgi:hypothetical protein